MDFQIPTINRLDEATAVRNAKATLKEAVMTAIENACFAGVPPEEVEQVINELLSKPDPLHDLSNQAKWYFAGNFPVYERACVGHAKPEPKALQELVIAGLVYFVQDNLRGNYWNLTTHGRLVKQAQKKFF